MFKGGAMALMVRVGRLSRSLLTAFFSLMALSGQRWRAPFLYQLPREKRGQREGQKRPLFPLGVCLSLFLGGKAPFVCPFSRMEGRSHGGPYAALV